MFVHIVGKNAQNVINQYSGRPIYVWVDCNKEIGSKCYVCGGPKKGPGTAGATGPGVLCNKCYKSSTCAHCGEKINP
jgi:hypothetical protein